MLAFGVGILSGCQHVAGPPPGPPPPSKLKVVSPPVEAPPPAIPLGEVIVVAGHRFPTGTRVITWLEKGAYRATPKTYDVRLKPPLPGEKEPRKALPSGLVSLQGFVDQLVLHYDQSGVSRICFDALEQRGLSIHFMIEECDGWPNEVGAPASGIVAEAVLTPWDKDLGPKT